VGLGQTTNMCTAEAKNEKFMRGDMVEDGLASDDGYTGGDDDVGMAEDEAEGI
jgi:hypothetical protein